MKKVFVLFLGCLILFTACSNPDNEEDENIVNGGNNNTGNNNGNSDGGNNGNNNETINGTAEEIRIITLVNQERAKVGAPALKVHNALMESAKIRAKEVKESQLMNHYRPDGSWFNTSIKIPVLGSGENLTMGVLPENAMAAWMESTGHRNNLLNKNWTHIGVGSHKFIPIIGGNVWAQHFARID